MSKKSCLLAVALCVLSAMPAVSQIVRPAPRVGPRVAVHEEPCWKQAGISKAAIEERNAIGRETRAQVEAVCADSALTPQQKHEKIREIREQAKARSEALVSPAQQEELQACQKARAASHPHHATAHGGGRGPCGELQTVTKPHPGGKEKENPPAEEENSD